MSGWIEMSVKQAKLKKESFTSVKNGASEREGKKIPATVRHRRYRRRKDFAFFFFLCESEVS